MDRRAFLRNAVIVAAGAIAADQLELVERLGWRRRFFSGFGAGVPTLWGDGEHDDTLGLQALLNARPFKNRTGRKITQMPGLTVIPDRIFRVSEPLLVSGQSKKIMYGVGAHIEHPRSAGTMLEFDRCQELIVRSPTWEPVG